MAQEPRICELEGRRGRLFEETAIKLVLISDTHGMHRRMLHPIPAGDVLIHCGDVSGHGSASEISQFVAWLCEQPHSHKLFVAGNHDAALAAKPPLLMEIINSAWVRNDCRVHYLEDESIEIDGVKFYGAPWTPEFMNWHFMLPRDGTELKAKWAAIPGDTQVLITHGPAYGINDLVEERYGALLGAERAGCKLLFDRIAELSELRFHACGHIHEGYGMNGEYGPVPVTIDGHWGRPICVNAATCNRNYEPVNRPIVMDL